MLRALVILHANGEKMGKSKYFLGEKSHTGARVLEKLLTILRCISRILREKGIFLKRNKMILVIHSLVLKIRSSPSFESNVFLTEKQKIRFGKQKKTKNLDPLENVSNSQFFRKKESSTETAPRFR
jgi:hypothetical protein